MTNLKKLKNLYPILIGLVIIIFVSIFIYDKLELYFEKYKSLIDFIVILIGGYNFFYIFKLKNNFEDSKLNYNFKLYLENYYSNLEKIREDINRLKKSIDQNLSELLEKVKAVDVILDEIKEYDLINSKKYLVSLDKKIEDLLKSENKESLLTSEIDDIYTDLTALIYTLKQKMNKNYFEVENE